MKVNELLSAPTISSSRTLTIYSATVIAVLLTGTKLDDFPGISWLEGDETTLTWIMLTVLVFMGVAHLINWSNDKTSISTAKARGEYEKHALRMRSVSGPRANIDEMIDVDVAQVRGFPDKVITPQTKHALDKVRFAKATKIWNMVLRHGMHLAVPYTLAAVAAFGLVNNI